MQNEEEKEEEAVLLTKYHRIEGCDGPIGALLDDAYPFQSSRSRIGNAKCVCESKRACWQADSTRYGRCVRHVHHRQQGASLSPPSLPFSLSGQQLSPLRARMSLLQS